MTGEGRVEASSDGVLAIVSTLLALDLHVEASGDLVQQLGQRRPNFAALLEAGQAVQRYLSPAP